MAHMLHFAGTVPLMWVTLGVHVCKLCMHGANRSRSKVKSPLEAKKIQLLFVGMERANCAVTKRFLHLHISSTSV